MTDTSQSRLAYIAETNYGVTPATPTLKVLRYTSENLKPDSAFVTSNEIRADRNVADVTLVGLEASGDIAGEMSYGTYDDFLEAVLGGTWTTNVLKNGVVDRSFTLEKTLKTPTTDNFHRFAGMKLNTFNLTARAREIITASFGFLGKGGTSAQAIITGATYTPANTNPVMNAANNISGLAITGVTSPQVMDLSLSITNNMRQQPVIGQLNSKGVGSGRFVVNGQATLYFENKDAYELFLSDAYADLSFSIGGASTQKYAFLLPKLKFTGVEVSNSGNDADLMITLPFQAIYNATQAATIQITRTP